jgi:hypothetical protein
MKEGRRLVLESIERARQLRRQGTRPPVNPNENACIHCSLAPVCLPEEGERLLTFPQWEPVRLFPATVDGDIVHLVTPSTVMRKGEALTVKSKGETIGTYPIRSITAIVAHGNVQITTQRCTSALTMVCLCTGSPLLEVGISPHLQPGPLPYRDGLDSTRLSVTPRSASASAEDLSARRSRIN